MLLVLPVLSARLVPLARAVPLAQPALTVRGGRLVPLVLTERAVRLARLAQLALMVHGVLMV